MHLARIRTSLLALLAVLAPLATPDLAASQSPGGELNGRVVKDGAPVAGAEVTLHHVSSQGSGPAGSLATGPDGAFRFALPAAGDTSGFNVFFVTVEHQSIRYFGAPVHPGEAPVGYTVQLYDTTSVLPGAVRIARRDVILLPGTDGSWSANELVRVVNTGGKTLVPSGGAPTWEMTLPEGATDVEVTEGDVASADVRLMGDRVVYLGAIVPGARELVLRYSFPEGAEEVVLRTSEPVDTFGVYLPEAAASATVTGLASTRVVPVQSERFVQHLSTGLAAGHEVGIAWAAAGPPVDPVVAGVVAALLILVVGTWVGLRARDGVAGTSAAPQPHPR